jgi:predicted RNA-binding protein with PUA-like domain
VVIDVAPVSRLPRPVTLAEIKAEQQLADWALVRIGRLSIVPVSATQSRKVESLAKSSPPAARKRGTKS